MLISSDGHDDYVDCRITDGGGEDKVELELDGKGQLGRVEIFCGRHCQLDQEEGCAEPSSRTVVMNLSGGTSLVDDGTTGAALLNAIRVATGEKVYIQFWPVSKNNWTSLIHCMASSVTRSALSSIQYFIDNPSELNKYKFYSGPNDCDQVEESDDPLMFGIKHMNVDVTQVDGTWTIKPSDVQDEPVR